MEGPKMPFSKCCFGLRSLKQNFRNFEITISKEDISYLTMDCNICVEDFKDNNNWYDHNNLNCISCGNKIGKHKNRLVSGK